MWAISMGSEDLSHRQGPGARHCQLGSPGIGKSLHRTTAAIDMRDWEGQEILKSCTRGADMHGFEEMNRR